MTKNFISLKSVTTAFCLASSVLGYAQSSTDAVSFEDVKLKEAILKAYPTVDANKDGEISFEEAQKVTIIRLADPVGNKDIVSAKGIEAFINLTNFTLVNSKLTSIDVSQLTKLSVLNLKQNQIAGALDVSMLTELSNLELTSNQLTQLLLPKQDKLRFIYLNDNLLTELDASQLPKLSTLNIVRNQLNTINLSGNQSLLRLHLDSNQLQSLDLTGLSKLNWLNVDNNQLTTLGFKGNTALKSIFLKNNTALSSLDFQNGDAENISILNVEGSTSLTTILKDCNDALPATLPASIDVKDNCGNLSLASVSSNSFSVYPNPTTEKLYIQTEHRIIDIKLFDELGQNIPIQWSDGTVNVKHLNRGLYWLQIQTEHGSIIHKVVKK
ncbi:leucine-rich repeat domain-containing protein [Bergeyella porcorum]|uniref:leucine-rich repeat domain-containing protein n=1 Tax=Bergeyella porcorum TaxID=1735111 RepID=UPI0035EDFD06